MLRVNKIILRRNLNGWTYVCKSLRTDKELIKKNGIITKDYDIQFGRGQEIIDEIFLTED